MVMSFLYVVLSFLTMLLLSMVTKTWSICSLVTALMFEQIEC